MGQFMTIINGHWFLNRKKKKKTNGKNSEKKIVRKKFREQEIQEAEKEKVEI